MRLLSSIIIKSSNWKPPSSPKSNWGRPEASPNKEKDNNKIAANFMLFTSTRIEYNWRLNEKGYDVREIQFDYKTNVMIGHKNKLWYQKLRLVCYSFKALWALKRAFF